MDLFQTVHARRSVRKFKAEKPVSREDVRDLLRAAMAAPSAGNAQPWHFVVIDDPALLGQVPAFSPYAAFAAKAPLAILVCAEPALEKYPGFWPQDCSAATQNLLLAATAKGLGATWTAAYHFEDRMAGFRRLLGIPETIMPLALVVVGHPDQDLSPQDRFRPERIHENRW